jgi:hypothetical protein
MLATQRLTVLPIKRFLYFLLVFSLTGCVTSVTKTKNPVFNSMVDSLQIKLSRVVRFEHINLSGKEITSQSKTNSELEIDVINPANTPVDESGTIVICKELASQASPTNETTPDIRESAIINYILAKFGY